MIDIFTYRFGAYAGVIFGVLLASLLMTTHLLAAHVSRLCTHTYVLSKLLSYRRQYHHSPSTIYRLYS
jgi:hypothetical protein